MAELLQFRLLKEREPVDRPQVDTWESTNPGIEGEVEAVVILTDDLDIDQGTMTAIVGIDTGGTQETINITKKKRDIVEEKKIDIGIHPEEEGDHLEV